MHGSRASWRKMPYVERVVHMIKERKHVCTVIRPQLLYLGDFGLNITCDDSMTTMQTRPISDFQQLDNNQRHRGGGCEQLHGRDVALEVEIVPK